MTVAELIMELQKYYPHTEVFLNYETFVNIPNPSIRLVEIDTTTCADVSSRSILLISDSD